MLVCILYEIDSINVLKKYFQKGAVCRNIWQGVSVKVSSAQVKNTGG